MIEVAAIFIGVGFIFSICSRSNKTNAEFLDEATMVDELKGLGEFLETKPLNNTVVVFGTVGSTSTVETMCKSALGVFVEETATVTYDRRNCVGLTREHESTLVNRKEVSWYLEDGTARVNVTNYQHAKGFDDILRTYSSTVPVSKHFKRLLSVEEITICDPDSCESWENVLEIGTPLTIVGAAGRDKDGNITIRHVYQVFNKRIELKKLISKMESKSVNYGNFSIYFAAMGMVLLALSLLQDDD
ncbi:E3 Ubiquitin ligase GIDE-type [Arabidopsis suecica]|uniref:RING-type E3 ubiquitin transferase n=1 Tax=Arabidopsis suecica TaxID=45249 RepID=A0A8T2CCF0_ARASU|nr:E3 Ubiquitin ligase GIDE-type [Arabidopsis suecica]